MKVLQLRLADENGNVLDTGWVMVTDTEEVEIDGVVTERPRDVWDLFDAALELASYGDIWDTADLARQAAGVEL